MVKIAKTDVRSALRDILKDEMNKQQKSELNKMMEQRYRESYSEYCPYCERIATVDGTKPETTTEEIKGKKYLVGKCPHCEKPLYVYVKMEPPASFLGEPSFTGYFFTKEHVHGEAEIPILEEKKKPKLHGSIFRT